MKWYKLKPDTFKASDPLLSLMALLFEALKVKIEETQLQKLHPVTQFLFEETSPPKFKKPDERHIN